ncbi:MAG: hypothetical protein ACOZD0_04725 [Pseudomonadota bacterium]
MVKWVVIGAVVIAGVFWLLMQGGGDISMGGEHGMMETHEATPAASAASN